MSVVIFLIIVFSAAPIYIVIRIALISVVIQIIPICVIIGIVLIGIIVQLSLRVCISGNSVSFAHNIISFPSIDGIFALIQPVFFRSSLFFYM